MLESRKGSGLKKLLRSLSPQCSDVVRGCQLSSRLILRGQDCCQMFFKKFRYQPVGMCIEGSLAEQTPAERFPLAYGDTSRLAVIVNTDVVNSVDLDHRVVPWDSVRSGSNLI